jgi:L-2-hydroxycarboxylate dehydrogenase (NAD+)
VAFEPLAETTAAILRKVGVPEDDARLGADAIVRADLRGVDSHGVSNMFRRYVEGYRSGNSNPTPHLQVLTETPATAHIDGDHGLGIVVAPKAMQVAIEKARTVGVGMVTVRNAGHFGMSQYHAMLALPHDMVGMAMTATGPFMLPTYGREPRLGTNPICLAAPCNEEPAFVYDAATTVVAGNKISTAKRLGVPLPGGILGAEDGTPIMEPRPAPDNYNGLLPLGSAPEMSSHKGYGLACMVDVLCNTLGGMTFGMQNRRGYGHFVAAISIAAFGPVDEFKQTMDEFVRTLKNTPPAAGAERVLAPGQIEWETQQERGARGIPLHPEVVAWFDSICAELGVEQRLPRD